MVNSHYKQQTITGDDYNVTGHKPVDSGILRPFRFIFVIIQQLQLSCTKNKMQDMWNGFLHCRIPCPESAADWIKILSFDGFF